MFVICASQKMNGAADESFSFFVFFFVVVVIV